MQSNNQWYVYNEAPTVITFVHGILSDSQSCWQYKAKDPLADNVYWPQLVSADVRFGGPSIYLGGYYTSIGSGGYEISDCAHELYHALKRVDAGGRPGPFFKERILFVCHSMGGIVVRYLLEKHAHDFRDKTIGLVLLASPSYGSKTANGLDFLVKFYRHQQGVQLKWGDWGLRDLDKRFKDLLYEKRIPNLRGIEAYEHHFILYNKFLPNRTVIVTAESAGRYFSAPVMIPNTDHFSIAKPDNQAHPSHKLLIDFWSEFESEFPISISSASKSDGVIEPIPEKGGIPTSVSLGSSAINTSDVGPSIASGAVPPSFVASSMAGSTFAGGAAYGIDLAPEPVTDQTPAIDKRSMRKLLVDELEVSARDSRWLGLNGAMGSGKTQLALLIAERFNGNVCWIRMRGLNTALAALKLDRVVEAYVGSRPQGTWFDWYSMFAERLGPDSVVVIDDLPNLRGVADLEERMAQLHRVLSRMGIAMLTTSNYNMPTDLVTGCDIVQTIVPQLTIEECCEILTAYGAPISLLEGRRLELLKVWARSNPFLLAVLAVFLSKRNWSFDEATLGDLISAKFAEPVERETIQKFLDTVEDGAARELLYRLSLTTGRFSKNEIEAVAAVEPMVSRPLEVLARLSGIWFQDEGDGKYDLTPLVRVIGSKLLSQGTIQNCHAVLGHSILKRDKLSLWEFSLVITHYFGAKLYNEAGRVLMLVLTQLQDAPDNVWPDVHLFWWETPLPKEMEWQIKVGIRCLQLILGRRLGLDYTYVYTDLESNLLTEPIGDSDRELHTMLALFALASIESEVDMAASRLRSTLKLRLPSTTELEDPSTSLRAVRGGLIWIVGRLIKSATDLSEWTNLLQEVNPNELEYAMSEEYAEFGILKVTETPWITESKIEEERRDWPVVLEALDKCAKIAEILGLELLWAASIRAQILVHSAFLKSVAYAETIAHAANAKTLSDPRATFLIAEAIGTQLVRTAKTDSGERWLRIALDQATSAYSYFRLPAIGHLAWAIGMKDPVGAAEVAEEALQYSLSNDESSDVERFRAGAECALAWWWAGDQLRAFELWDMAAEILIEADVTHNSWKEAYVLFMHASAYLGSIVRRGAPPHLEDGEEFAAPRLGFFLTENVERLAYYQPNTKSYLALHLAWFAEGVAHESAEEKWLNRTIKYGQEENRPIAVASATIGRLGYQVPSVPLLETLKAVRSSVKAQVAFKQLSEAGSDVVLGDDMSTPLEFTAGESRLAEAGTQYWTILPLAFHLALMTLDGKERLIEEVVHASDAFREIARDSVLKEVWNEVAEAVKETFIAEYTFGEIIRRANQLEGEDLKPVRALMYIGASIRPRTSLCESLRAQTSVMEFTSRGVRESAFRKLLFPFFVKFWSAKIEMSPFRFRSVQMLRDELILSARNPSIRGLKHLISTLAFSLECTLDPDVQKWISQNEDG